MPDYSARRNRLRALLRKDKQKPDGLLVTNFVNVSYLTGFTGDDSYLLVTLDGELLISDQRYTTQLEEECPGLKQRIRVPGEKMVPTTIEEIKSSGTEKLGVEGASMSVGLFQELAEQLPKVSLHSTSGLVEELRMIKDKDELEAMRAACYQAKRAYEVVKASLTPTTTERQVAADLEFQARRFGAKCLSFPPIIGVGERAALPHGRPTDKPIGAADFTLIDWGANSGLYMSDLTRMVVTGKITPKFQKLYELVLAAQEAAIAAIKPGKKCEEIDAIARDIIKKGGHGPKFGHGLGHSLGLEIHEAPRFAKDTPTILEPGMVMTVEPGVYFPGWGGIRIEDDVLVTKTGYEVITDVPKRLVDCTIS